ncbi:hypothetical protein MKZ25_08415 [Solibacillus sp. FSL W7-1464]|uniref:hypothetical protein n=1 Tax=Solibacillus sp. FSL W7-1464 TaxID=2921706 RepID=UPI0030FCB6CF
MDVELIKHYVYELHWHLPEEIQQEAIGWLVAHTPRHQLALVFPPYGKNYWKNSMKVVTKIGYPYNIAAFPSMVKLFQDINWPGAEEAVQYFQTLQKSTVLPYIEAGAKQAMAEQEEQWLWFLYAVCERLHIVRGDFLDSIVFDKMEEIYTRDA